MQTAAEQLDGPAKRRGLKPGQRHSGSFKPGEDPRRRGDAQKLALRKEVSALCQVHTQQAVDLLVEVMTNESEQTRARLVAADMLLSYGHGRPVTREQHLSIVARVQGDSGSDPKSLTDEQLLGILQNVADASTQAKAQLEQDAGPIVDGEIVGGED